MARNKKEYLADATQGVPMRIREGRIAEYDGAHRHVWPELIAELQSFGVTDYSIFRRGQSCSSICAFWTLKSCCANWQLAM